jgi:hypothetical protein
VLVGFCYSIWNIYWENKKRDEFNRIDQYFNGTLHSHLTGTLNDPEDINSIGEIVLKEQSKSPKLNTALIVTTSQHVQIFPGGKVRLCSLTQDGQTVHFFPKRKTLHKTHEQRPDCAFFSKKENFTQDEPTEARLCIFFQKGKLYTRRTVRGQTVYFFPKRKTLHSERAEDRLCIFFQKGKLYTRRTDRGQTEKFYWKI